MKHITRNADTYLDNLAVGQTFTKHDIAEVIGCKSDDLSWFISKNIESGHIETDGWLSLRSKIRVYKKIDPDNRIVKTDPLDLFNRMKLI